MSSTCKPAISTSITLNQTTPMRFFASFRTLYSLENTLTSNFDQNNFWSLTVARNCNAVTAKKGCHRFFHLSNISRAFSPRSQWHCPKSITCLFFAEHAQTFFAGERPGTGATCSACSAKIISIQIQWCRFTHGVFLFSRSNLTPILAPRDGNF